MTATLTRVRTAVAAALTACTLATFALWLLSAAAPAAASPAALIFSVTSAADVPDGNPGDGVCETGPSNNVCTLRAAVQETNKHLTTSVTIRLQSGVTYFLSRAGVDDSALNGDLDLTGTVTIEGAGPQSTIIDANQIDRVFELAGTIVISGVTVQHGKATANNGYGAGVYSRGILTIANSYVISNTALELNDSGGGIYGSLSTTVQSSLIAGNVISGAGGVYGGGIFAASYLSIIDSTIARNRSSGTGGGIMAGLGVIRNSTISGNLAADGGGLRAGSTSVVNTTVSGNYATNNGAGIYSSGSTTLLNVTIANNTANDDANGSGGGGGIYMASGSVSIANSIIASNYYVSPGPFLNDDDCSGTLTSLGYNIIATVLFHCTVNGSYSTAWPSLGPLQFNGGATQTHALPANSPAVNAGDPGGCTDLLGAPLTTDQRGKPRPGYGAATRCDLGAYEFTRDLFLPLIRR